MRVCWVGRHRGYWTGLDSSWAARIRNDFIIAVRTTTVLVHPANMSLAAVTGIRSQRRSHTIPLQHNSLTAARPPHCSADLQYRRDQRLRLSAPLHESAAEHAFDHPREYRGISAALLICPRAMARGEIVLLQNHTTTSKNM